MFRNLVGCVVAVLKFIDPEVAFFVRIGARLTSAQVNSNEFIETYRPGWPTTIETF